MEVNPIGVVICRIGAVFLAVSAVRGLGFVIAPLLNPSGAGLEFWLMLGLMVLAPFVTAFLIWGYAEQISSVPVISAHMPKIESLSPQILVQIGTYLIGVYVLVFGVVSAFESEATAWAQSNMFRDSEITRDTLSPHTIGNRVSYFAQIVIGLALLILGKRR